ncbi:MAG: hypothetical protein GY854_19765 [Deltaproteobacteria bacterium]|nr:hypothetical protein [Deltaproteobacteria bacterium]
MTESKDVMGARYTHEDVLRKWYSIRDNSLDYLETCAKSNTTKKVGCWMDAALKSSLEIERIEGRLSGDGGTDVNVTLVFAGEGKQV